ncbi:MAG: PIN domain-containing protein [Candidatus Lokiarchaeota archaeon]|nr:PIN domain-containing protein [Candidatus Lokiarchaeota archaeon]
MNIKEILIDTPNLVLDTSVLLGYFMNEAKDINSLLEEYIFTQESKIILYGHNLIKTELFYVICREKGVTEAEMVLKKIEGIMNIISDTWLFKKAANIKCRYPLAISDCFSISLSILQECPLFFLPEVELSKTIVDKINREYNAKIQIV